MNPEEKQIEFMKLYEPCRESLVRFAQAMARSREDALDLVQETTLKAFDSFERLNNKQAFKSYMFTIASRLYKRQSWRRRLVSVFSNKEEDGIDPLEKIISHESSPDSGYDVEVLYKALEKLPKLQREAVILYEISGLSMDEICKIQGGTVPGVKSRVRRARIALSKMLSGDGVREESQIENYLPFEFGAGKGLRRRMVNRSIAFPGGINE